MNLWYMVTYLTRYGIIERNRQTKLAQNSHNDAPADTIMPNGVVSPEVEFVNYKKIYQQRGNVTTNFADYSIIYGFGFAHDNSPYYHADEQQT